VEGFNRDQADSAGNGRWDGAVRSPGRDLAVEATSETIRRRNAAAALRDKLAAERDRVAVERDARAARQDAEVSALEREDDELVGRDPPDAIRILRQAGDRRRAGATRARAAAHRMAAAQDRREAARDRKAAAADRKAAAAEIASEGLDPVTGALQRRVGLAAVQREMDRTLRLEQPLTIAFVDVVGLKRINDARGHAAGDAVLQAVSSSILGLLRSYDLVTRVGGDEFVCSLTDQDTASVTARFRAISEALVETVGTTITVGVVTRDGEERLETLIRRADQAMLAQRGPPERS
jgi:diguanylate cyclase (GGDEF)-like protein